MIPDLSFEEPKEKSAPATEPPSEPAEEPPAPEANVSLRPRDLASFVGQPSAVGAIRTLSEGARRRDEPTGHVLLYGPAGLGKTTLGRLAASERGGGFHEALAGTIRDPHQLLSLLSRLERNDVLLIDEIHRLSPVCQEALLSALEDGFVHFLMKNPGRENARSFRLRLEPFTLIGATTELGKLSAPLRGRFRLTLSLKV